MGNEIREATQDLIDDRDSLATENNYLKSVIAAQQLQLNRYEELLRSTQGEQPSDSQNLESASGSWIKSFFYDRTVDDHLASIIKAWNDHNGTQRALALATLALAGEMEVSQRISALLLFSTILRETHHLEKALDSADEALQLAAESGDPYLIGKSHYHRGVCFLHYEMLADARWSFVLASNTDPDYRAIVGK